MDTFTSEEMEEFEMILFYVDRKLLREPDMEEGYYWFGDGNRVPIHEGLTKQQALDIIKEHCESWAEKCEESCKTNGLDDWEWRGEQARGAANRVKEYIKENF